MNESDDGLHQQYEPEKPIHRAVNITYRHLQDRIKPVKHDEYDIWKGVDEETGREGYWWDSPEEAVEMLAKTVGNEMCFLNECTTHLGEDSDRLYCDEHHPDEYVECAVDDCDYPTNHTETDHCSTHTWRHGRTAKKKVVTDGGVDESGQYEYEHDGQREHDDKHASKARDLARAGIETEARREAGKIQHYPRCDDVLDEVIRLAR